MTRSEYDANLALVEAKPVPSWMDAAPKREKRADVSRRSGARSALEFIVYVAVSTAAFGAIALVLSSTW
jgi:hypothetical protein